MLLEMAEGPGVALQPAVRPMSPHAEPHWHEPVLAHEVLQCLAPRSGAILVDGTLGTGGHSAMLLPRLLPAGRLIGIDLDPQSLEAAQQRLREFLPQLVVTHGNYRRLAEILARLGITAIDGLLLDLGMSSPQVDQAARGFSFLREGALDMRMDPSQQTTAAMLVNEWSADDLTDMLSTLGEERFAQRIARQMVRERQAGAITTTAQLAALVARAVPRGARYGRLHPATRTFQALRIAVNDELGALEALLGDLPRLLNPGGRAVIIAYHSLEDRLVKHAFAQGMRDGLWTVLTKKPVRPGDAEAAENPRARSAKLRAVERRR